MIINAKIKSIIVTFIAYFWMKLFLNKVPISKQIKSILLVFPSGIGNTILANGAIKSIKKHYPYAELTVVYMQRSTKDIITIIGGFKELVYYDISNERKEGNQFINRIKAKNVDISVSFFPQGSYSFNKKLMQARIPTRIGFLLPRSFGGIRSVLFLSHCFMYNPKISEFRNNLNLLKHLDVPLEKSVSFRLNKYNIIKVTGDKTRIGFHVGRPNAQRPGWSIENFSKLIFLLRNKYEADIFVFGGSEEMEVSRCLEDIFKKHINNYIGEKSLEETIDYIHSMDLFVSNDTGLMHIAASQGIPLIALFGPTDAVKSLPILQNNKKYIIIKKESLCSPCYPQAPQVACNGRVPCMKNITPDEVLISIEELTSRIKV
ncbi:MAG: glycosyltransferase family 9 protein [Candidatus Omnitrophota bacterium]